VILFNWQYLYRAYVTLKGRYCQIMRNSHYSAEYFAQNWRFTLVALYGYSRHQFDWTRLYCFLSIANRRRRMHAMCVVLWLWRQSSSVLFNPLVVIVPAIKVTLTTFLNIAVTIAGTSVSQNWKLTTDDCRYDLTVGQQLYRCDP